MKCLDCKKLLLKICATFSFTTACAFQFESVQLVGLPGADTVQEDMQNAQRLWLKPFFNFVPPFPISYLTAANPTNPQLIQLSNLQDGFVSYYSPDAVRGWNWDAFFPPPWIYCLTASDPTNPHSAQFMNLQSFAFANVFSTDASAGWMWDEFLSSPYIYYFTAPDPSSASFTQLMNLTQAQGRSFSTDAARGWIWDANTLGPYIYYLTAPNPSNMTFTTLPALVNANGNFFSRDAMRGWIWDQFQAFPSLYYLDATVPTDNTKVASLSHLQDARAYNFGTDATQGWIWDPVGALPYVYYVNASSPTTPLFVQLNPFNGGADAAAFDTAMAATGWIWSMNTSMPYLYHFDANTPTMPQQVQLMNLTNAFGSAFNADAMQGWIWDVSSNPFIYHVQASGFPGTTVSVPLMLSNARAAAFGKPDASVGWIWDVNVVTPSIYYFTASAPTMPEQTVLLNLQNANNNFFSPDVTTGWIWDANVASPFIYYLDAATLPTVQSVSLPNLQNANGHSFSLDATQGWIWDQGIASPSIYLINSFTLTNPQSVQLSNLQNAFGGGFNLQDATQIWIWDAGVPDPWIYYLTTAATPAPPSVTTIHWAAGLGGVGLNSVFNMLIAQEKVLYLQGVNGQGLDFLNQRQPEESALLVDADELFMALICGQEQPKPSPDRDQTSCSIWVTPFNDYFVQGQQGVIPRFTNEVAGVLAAVESQVSPCASVGGGAAYAFNDVHYSRQLGHARINQEVGVVFGTWQGSRLYVNAACWGGVYQFHGKRHTDEQITATAKTKGIVLSPHIEFDVKMRSNRVDWLQVAPFAMVDWSNIWQKKYEERAAGGLTLKVPHQYASLLRSEIGISFYEVMQMLWGRILFTEKVSYVNQTPFHTSAVSSLFIGSASLFSVANGTLSSQNLCAVGAYCLFDPNRKRVPYVAINLQGEFGSSLQSYFAAVQIGKRF